MLLSIHRPLASSLISFLLAIGLLPQSGQNGTHDKRQVQIIQHFNESLAKLRQDVMRSDYAIGVAEGKLLLRTAAAISSPEREIATRRYLGAAQLGSGSYRDSLRTLLPGRDLAVRHEDFRNLYSISSNIAWVYLEMNNPQSAGRFEDEALLAERESGEFNVRPIISRAFIYGYVADFPNAERMFSDGIDRSLAAGKACWPGPRSRKPKPSGCAKCII
jgi:hypothetical protein